MKTQTRFAALAGFTVAGTLAFTACTSDTMIPKEPVSADPDTDVAGSFLACLDSSGVEAKINSSGQVLVKAPAGSAEDGVISSTDGALAIEGDDEGNTWVVPVDATYFAQAPDIQAAYAACEEQYPNFEQPQFDSSDDPVFEQETAEQEEAALAFAQCARSNGYSNIEDPDFSRANALQIPGDLTEDNFRALLDECWDRGAPVFNFAQPVDAPFEAWAVLEEFLNAPAS